MRAPTRKPRPSRPTPAQTSIEEYEEVATWVVVPGGKRRGKRKKLEGALQKRILRLLSLYGWIGIRVNSGMFKTAAGHWVRCYNIEGLGSKGHPDVVAHREHDGIVNQSLFIEVKGPDGELEPSQKAFIALAEAMGVKVHVMDDWDEAIALIERIGRK